MKLKPHSFTLPSEMLTRLKAASAEMETTMSAVVRNAIDEFLDSFERVRTKLEKEKEE